MQAELFAVDTATFNNPKGMGAIFDEPDDRDHQYTDYLQRDPDLAALQSIPKAALLKPLMGTAYNQGVLGSCTAQVGAKEYEYLSRRQGIVDPVLLSRLQIYYNSRKSLNPSYVTSDTGSTGRATCKVLADLGAAPEALWPYADTGNKYRQAPSQEAKQAGYSHNLLEYLSIPSDGGARTLELIKTSLAEGHPVGFSIMLPQSFKTDKYGIVNDWSGDVVGGHRMLITGYSDWVQRFQVMNSWGKEWGLDGFCAVPYDIITQGGRDFWTFRRVEDGAN